MLADAVTDDDIESAILSTNVINDSCRIQFTDIVPLIRDIDDPCTTDRDTEENSTGVKQKQEDVPVVKQEPNDVTMLYLCDVVVFSSCRPISII